MGVTQRKPRLYAHADGSRCVGRLISGVCDFVCGSVCLTVQSALQKENDLSYWHQTRHAWAYSPWKPKLKMRFKVQGHMPIKCAAGVDIGQLSLVSLRGR